jgi:hypothetical protein
VELKVTIWEIGNLATKMSKNVAFQENRPFSWTKSGQIGRKIVTITLTPGLLKKSFPASSSTLGSFQHNLLPYTITMVSALSLQEVLLERPIGDYSDGLDKNHLIQIRKAWLGKGQSWLLVRF